MKLILGLASFFFVSYIISFFLGEISLPITYKPQLMSALLISATSLMAFSGILFAGMIFYKVPSEGRHRTRIIYPLFLSIIIGLFTLVFSVTWYIASNDWFLLSSVSTFNIQVGIFIFLIFHFYVHFR